MSSLGDARGDSIVDKPARPPGKFKTRFAGVNLGSSKEKAFAVSL